MFTFDKQTGKIDNVSFGLGKTAETDILCKGDWPEEVRMAILQFMENYKTAYSLKRLKYIESIFADDAIIIVGNVVKKASLINSDLANKMIINDIVSGLDKNSYVRITDRTQAIREALVEAKPGDTVLIAGKGHEKYQIFGTEKIHYDEREIVKQILDNGANFEK